MKRFLLTAALLLFPMFAHAQSEEAQALVDRSTIALQEMMTQDVSHTPRAMLDRSRAVLICPRVFKAGFFFGGSGGNCVLLARAGNGTWSYPAFFTIGSASFGFQIGVQDSSLVLLVLTDRGLDALMNSHFKLGGDASIAIATIGAGVQGALTTGITADIVAFQATRGAFAGISVEGSVLNSRTDLDQAYYGRPLDTRQIEALEVESIRTLKTENDDLRKHVKALEDGHPIPASTGFNFGGANVGLLGLAAAIAYSAARRKQGEKRA